MEPLLAWALRIVEDIGPDIRDAWIEHRQLDDATHPSHQQYHGLLMKDRIEMFVQLTKREGVALPGRAVDGGLEINWNQLGRILGHRSSWPPTLKQRVHAAGLPIVEGSPVGCINGLVDDRPWRHGPITIHELPLLIRVLTAACFITTCYLSGARSGEVLNLESGCADTDEATGELLIRGRAGKGRGRSASAEDLAANTRPWVVVEPVHRAVEMMDSLTSHRYLFPASIAVPGSRRPNDEHARTSRQMNLDIDAFITWVNTVFQASDGAPPIPADPLRRVHASRFRRTLAYFIVRRPRGLIAAALQYAHVSTTVTLSYSGYADTAWMDDLAIERLEMVIDQIDDDLTLLEGGEHVSGSSAGEYRDRIARVSRFAGRTITGVRNADRLLTQADPNIHHGEAMTCVWRAKTAACRKAKMEQGLPDDDAPDESECRTTCQNLAYTDRDIDRLRGRLTILDASAVDPLAPHPLRDRATAQATRVRQIIQRHEQSRMASPNDEGTVE
jgi:integrase